MKRFRWLMFVAASGLLLASCAPAATPQPTTTPTEPRVLNVMTHDSFAASENVIHVFENANQTRVNFIKANDAGSALNQAILSKDAPLADVFFGVDNTFLGRGLDNNIFEPYQSPELANIPAELQLDKQFRLSPVDFGDVCVNYDKAWFADKKLPVPQSLDELAKPAYKSLLVVENPATSSPGLAFLMASVQHFGPEKFLDWWKALRANDVLVADGWEAAYYTNFSGSSGKGARPLVVSYATSPAAEVHFSEGKISEPPTGNLSASGACFRQIEFVGILKGTQNRELAEKWIDFMLSQAFQEDIPLQMFVFPANSNAKLPEVFQKFAPVPSQAKITLTPEEISKNRETWIDAWTTAVLR